MRNYIHLCYTVNEKIFVGNSFPRRGTDMYSWDIRMEIFASAMACRGIGEESGPLRAGGSSPITGWQ